MAEILFTRGRPCLLTNVPSSQRASRIVCRVVAVALFAPAERYPNLVNAAQH